MDAFAWPIAVVVVVVFALVLFRRDFSALINRTKEVGTGGLKTYENQPTQPVEEKKGVEDFFRTFENPLLIEAEGLILKELEGRNIKVAADREKALVRSLASSNILLNFERALGSIWQSQLSLLQYLNSRDLGSELSELGAFYMDAKGKYPSWYEDYSFDQWLGFLRSHNFITQKDSRVFITVAGREFLKYLIAAGKGGPSYG